MTDVSVVAPAVTSNPARGRWRVAALIVLGFALLGGAHSAAASPTAGDATTYVSAARSIAAGHGYHSRHEAGGVPRYPPGLSLLLVPAAWASRGVLAMQTSAFVLGLLLIAACWKCAQAIGGYPAAFGARVLILLSPGVLHSGSEIMSESRSV